MIEAANKTLMQKTPVEHQIAGGVPPLVMDMLNGKPEALKYVAYQPGVAAMEQAITDRKAKPIDRATLVEVLKEQHAGYSERFSQLGEHLSLLGGENTFTITTGHQLCLFTGPLYFLYKIMTAVKTCEELKAAYPNQDFVPVYWMASEDHDFEEINHAHLFGSTLEWERPGTGAVGRMAVESLEPVLSQLNEKLGEGEAAEKLSNWLQEAYQNKSNLSEATRHLVHELFGEYGVVVIDADDARLKACFAEIIKDDILNNTAFGKVEATSATFPSGTKVQVHPREINLFYLHEEKRERIIRVEAGYELDREGTTVSKEELMTLLKQYPERFSPNVILRPVYQEVILPNLAYIGGPSEIAYWLELKDVFDHYGVFFPMLMLRQRAMLINRSQEGKMQKNGLAINDLFQPLEALQARVARENSDSELDLDEPKTQAAELYEAIVNQVIKVDPSLKGAAEAERQKALKGLENLENKMVRAEKRKQETTLNQIESLKKRLFPGGPQERYDNFIPYYLRYGQDFLEAMHQHFDPFDFRLMVLTEEVKPA